MKSGIYIIQSISQPSRIYVGSSVNVVQRWKRHRRELAKNQHHSNKLQRHANKYGINDLEFDVLAYCPEKYLLKEEQYWINLLHTYFNVNPIAGSRLGAKHSIFSKIRIGKASRSGPKESIFSRYARLMKINQKS